jgi:hypothetical protein
MSCYSCSIIEEEKCYCLCSDCIKEDVCKNEKKFKDFYGAFMCRNGLKHLLTTTPYYQQAYDIMDNIEYKIMCSNFIDKEDTKTSIFKLSITEE